MDGADVGHEPRQDDPPAAVRHRRFHLDGPARREIVLALTLLFCYGFFRQVPAWNEYSRYDLVRALVEDGTTRIDRFEDNTGDKAFYAGHYYSDKAPGTALLGVGPYVILTAVYDAAGAGTPDQDAAVQTLAFFVSGIPTVLLGLLLLRFLRPAVGEPWAFVMALAYGLGSIAFPFATMYFGHAASALFLFAAFYFLWRWRAGHSAWLVPAAGFLAGWAVIVEFPTMLGALVLVAYALVGARPAGRRLPDLRWRAAIGMILGAALPAALLLGYDWVSFGAPLSLGYSNLGSGSFAEGMSQGILGVTWPKADVLVDLLAGPRGLVRLAPWFILAPVGLLAARRRELRPEVAVSAAIVIAFLLFNAGYYLPFGGWTPGPRFLLPALPFATVLVALAPRVVRPLAAVLVAVGVAFMFVATVTMPNAPEAFADPLFGLWLPRLLGGEIAETIAWPRWGLHGIQPLFLLGFGLGLAGLALVTTHRSEPGSGRRTGLLVGILVLLVMAVALPVAPTGAVDLAVRGPSSAGGSVAIVDAGAAPQLVDDARSVGLWVQAENQGPALADTRIVFTAFAPDGRAIWSGWFDGVDWQAGERKRSTIDWDSTKASAGDYRVGVTVESRDGTVVYAPIHDAGVVHVER